MSMADYSVAITNGSFTLNVPPSNTPVSGTTANCSLPITKIHKHKIAANAGFIPTLVLTTITPADGSVTDDMRPVVHYRTNGMGTEMVLVSKDTAGHLIDKQVSFTIKPKPDLN